MTTIHLADHIVPVSSEPFADGGVAIEGSKIVGIGTRDTLTVAFPNSETIDHGAAAIAPGFVNVHSHLEITAMRGALDGVEDNFAAWLLKLSAIRTELGEEGVRKGALVGAREGAAAGVTCFGDIGRLGRVGLEALTATGLRGIVFQETEFTPDNRTAKDDFMELAAKFEALKQDETELVRVALSPHSPYTVGSELFELLAQYSILNRIPLSIHAAESADEIELMAKGTGPFSTFYEKFGVEWSSPFSTPIEYLERLGVLATRPLLAHCVRVTDSDIERIEANGASVAHCPKSNAKFGHGAAPLEKFLDAGITVGLGSDSVASNNVCDLIEESRFAALTARNRVDSERFVTAEEVFECATLGGAKALGLDDLIGTLEAGKEADLAVVDLTDDAQGPVTDIYAALVFSSNARDVKQTIVAGKTVYSKGT
ncbi:MAG TPA: amidohydrolase family protein [Pyrinomonadaceae bacterium]|nr:amidohydrolase family protein [Pyrinomonadaceae bacterium]